MTFNLTISGESPTELLTALRQLSAPQQPEAAPVTQPEEPAAPAPAKPKKAAPKPAAAAPEKAPTPPQPEAQTADTAPQEPPAAPEIPVKDPKIEAKIRSLALPLMHQGKRAEVQQIITGTGASGISFLNPEDYSTVWAQLLKLDAEVNADAAG